MYAFPYWTGFYLSRPSLKIMQEQAIRLLQAAEVRPSRRKICLPPS